jgi:UDP:flavonoid glycosyltransferase YjiC (YdhE family)
MAKYLFTTLPSNDLGLLTRSLPIARGLRDRGHQIAFSSPARAPRALISAADFENLRPRHPLYQLSTDYLSPKGMLRFIRSKPWKDRYKGPLDFFFQLFSAIPFRFARRTPEVWNMDHGAAMAGMMHSGFVRGNCQAFISLIEDHDPDVIVDFWNPFACMAARVLNKPLVTVIQADGHPAGKGFIWWKPHPEGIPTVVPTVNRVLISFGADPITKFDDLNLGTLTLIMGTPDTDPLPPGAEGQYIGPILWEDPKANLPSWLEELESGKPVVWVYSGNPRYSKKATVVDSEVILGACIEALGDEDVQVVLTTGHHPIPEHYLPLPENFRFEPFLPGLRLAKRCDLMIHHGGYGSCQTGLISGTPAVIIPTFSERESNARRIAALGAGEFVLPETTSDGEKRIEINSLKKKVMNVLEKSEYRESAGKYGEVLRSYGGVEGAVDLIENMDGARMTYG